MLMLQNFINCIPAKPNTYHSFQLTERSINSLCVLTTLNTYSNLITNASSNTINVTVCQLNCSI